MGLQFTFLHLKNKLFDYNMILAFKSSSFSKASQKLSSAAAGGDK